MRLQEFKEVLLAEHERDKMLTQRFYSVVILLIVALLIFLAIKFGPALYAGITADDGVQFAPTWVLFVFPLIPLSWLAYPIYKIYSIRKRTVKIDDLILKIENNAIASEITNTKEYRVIIPLYYINFQLYPVEYIHITLSAPNYAKYSLPIPKYLIPDVKTILSGANMQEINKAWYELGTGNTQAVNVTTDKIKSVEEFRTFVNTELNDDLQNIETKRKSNKKKYIIGVSISVAMMFAWLGFEYFLSNKASVDTSNMTGEEVKQHSKDVGTYITTIVSVLFGACYVGYMFYTVRNNKLKSNNKEESFDFAFKTRILNRMIKFINPNFQYVCMVILVFLSFWKADCSQTKVVILLMEMIRS